MKFSMIVIPLLVFTTNAAMSNASDHPPEPVEYVFNDQYEASPRDEVGDAMSERVDVRGGGDRSDRWITAASHASVTLYLPDGEPTAAAVICPGGGYGGLSFDKEGTFVAEWRATSRQSSLVSAASTVWSCPGFSSRCPGRSRRFAW